MRYRAIRTSMYIRLWVGCRSVAASSAASVIERGSPISADLTFSVPAGTLCELRTARRRSRSTDVFNRSTQREAESLGSEPVSSWKNQVRQDLTGTVKHQRLHMSLSIG
jgi:hypothetical protein